jgi:DNA-directed RNA polymerase specialized sigma24 family protein
MTPPTGSITRLIPDLRVRDDIAIEELWRRYAARIERLARPVVAGLTPGAGDEQDVAQSAFYAFCEAAANGQAPQLENRNELWRLLAAISRRKAADRVRRELRDRRGGGAPRTRTGETDLAAAQPSPSQVAELQETVDNLFRELDRAADPKLKLVAIMRLEGADTHEIAAELGCTQRTIQRKLQLLQRLWTTDPH